MHGSDQNKTQEDWLSRVRITLPTTPIRAERCIATVVSPGYEGMLDGMLTTLHYAGNCANAVCVVFAVDADPACREVIARHGALAVECASLTPLNSRIRAVLYSIAEVAEAEYYACIDSDIFVLGDLQPLFAALEACLDGSILTCRDPYIHTFASTLKESLTTFYAGASEDVDLLLGDADEYAKAYPLLVNEGIIAGNRKALLALGGFLRSLPAAAKSWVDVLPNHGCRNQFLFNLALASLRCGVEMDPIFNYQDHLHTLDIQEEGLGLRALWNGRRIRIKHFPGSMREEYGWMRERLRCIAAD